MAAELWEAVKAGGGVAWGEEVYSEDEPLGDPSYEDKETDPEDVKNWKKIRREEVVEERRAAAAVLAEEEAAALSGKRRVEEKTAGGGGNGGAYGSENDEEAGFDGGYEGCDAA